MSMMSSKRLSVSWAEQPYDRHIERRRQHVRRAESTLTMPSRIDTSAKDFSRESLAVLNMRFPDGNPSVEW